MVGGRKFLGLAVIGFLVFGMLRILWALCPEPYNRPNPLMDYVPQEIGVYDSGYQTLTEADCRGCHGDSTADRHHLTPRVPQELECMTCHLPCEPGTPDCPNGTLITRDCLTSGCHSWDDVPTNGWHHDTDLSAPRNCVRCHNPNLIGEIRDFYDLDTYPPTVVVPLSSSCENCHWEQQHSSTGDPNNPGHPSTYDHYDVWDQFVGFHEYSRPIYGPFDTHHIGAIGECVECHGADGDGQGGLSNWDPYDPELIRYCERCHSLPSLHSIGPHMSGGNGWEPIGFHVPETNADCTDLIPTNYISYTADHQCLGCHTGSLPPMDPDCCFWQPAIGMSIAGIQPTAGSCGALVTLRGEYFGEEHSESRVQFKKKPDGDLWIDVPIHSWAYSLIEFEVPCWTFQQGNYWVRVKTSSGHSNERVFSFWGG
jgi:hypothetical protein